MIKPAYGSLVATTEEGAFNISSFKIADRIGFKIAWSSRQIINAIQWNYKTEIVVCPDYPESDSGYKKLNFCYN